MEPGYVVLFPALSNDWTKKSLDVDSVGATSSRSFLTAKMKHWVMMERNGKWLQNRVLIWTKMEANTGREQATHIRAISLRGKYSRMRFEMLWKCWCRSVKAESKTFLHFFSSMLFGSVLTRSRNVLDCRFRIHFLNCLKDGRKRPSVRKVFSSREKLKRAKFVCCVRGAIVWFGAVQFEDAYERAARWENYIYLLFERGSKCVERVDIFPFHDSEHNQSFKRYCKRFVSSASLHCLWDSHGDHRCCKRNAGGVCACRLWWWRQWQNILWRWSTVFIEDVCQPHSAAKSGITCPVEQLRTYMSEKANV